VVKKRSRSYTKVRRAEAGRSAHRAATIRHALDFTTWRSLDRITSSDRRAAALATS
jgi:hypothetical protein